MIEGIERKHNRGCETKLTASVEAAIVESIRNCASLESAAALAGITYRTFRNWMTWGDDGKRPYFHFFQAVTRAEHEAEVELVRVWRDATKIDWRAARDLLARRFPDRWMPQTKTGKESQGRRELIVQIRRYGERDGHQLKKPTVL